jgi:cytoskeletal protein CcmA (bactofilin family)
MNHIKNRLLMAAVILSSLAALDVKADIFSTCGVDLGAAGRTHNWAIFTLGAGTDKNVDMSGSAKAVGDVGAAGSGNVHMSGTATIQGDLYYHQPGSLNSSGKAKVTGHTFNDDATDALLDQGAMDAMNASTFAASLATSPQYTSWAEITSNKNMTIVGSGCTVLNLKNFKLSGSKTITLTGIAGTAFVINVSHQFSLSGSSKIVLSGALTAADVLINVTGKGSSIELSGSSNIQGILLAAKRDVHLSGSAVISGEVIANSVSLSGSAKVVQAVSPTRNR